MVAGVFVRIYNEQPAYALADAAAFAKGLVTWINACAGASLGPEAQQLTTAGPGALAAVGLPISQLLSCAAVCHKMTR